MVLSTCSIVHVYPSCLFLNCAVDLDLWSPSDNDLSPTTHSEEQTVSEWLCVSVCVCVCVCVQFIKSNGLKSTLHFSNVILLSIDKFRLTFYVEL